MNIFEYKWTPKFKDLVDKRNGFCVTSPVFHTFLNDNYIYWQIDFYPNGRRPLCTDMCSIFLHLAGSNMSYEIISARFQFELVTALPTMENYQTPLSEQHDFRKNKISDTSLCFQRFAPNFASLSPKNLLLLGEERILIKCRIELPRAAFKAPSTIHSDVPMTVWSSKQNSMFTGSLFELLTSQMPDVVLIAKDAKSKERKFYCHRQILIKNSTYFKSLLDYPELMIEMDENEFIPPTVYPMLDIDGNVLCEILRYIYTQSYNYENLKKIAPEVLPLAKEHSLKGLKSKCAYLMLENMNRENVISYLILADTYKLEELKKRAVTMIYDELKEIKEDLEWKTFLRSHPNLVQLLFDEVALCNVLAAF